MIKNIFLFVFLLLCSSSFIMAVETVEIDGVVIEITPEFCVNQEDGFKQIGSEFFIVCEPDEVAVFYPPFPEDKINTPDELIFIEENNSSKLNQPISVYDENGCIKGIDDVCDPNCAEVDYDCLENPRALTQDANCKAEPDGVCVELCRHIDWDCELAPRVVYDEEGDLIVAEEVKEDESLPFQDKVSSSFISSFDEKNTNQFILISIGVALLGVSLLLFFHQLRRRKDLKAYAKLLPYGQKALVSGYTQEQIIQSLKTKGHSKRFIKGYMKALEHRP